MSDPSAERPRYALYYAPRAEEALAIAASRWLGRSPDTGEARDIPPVGSIPRERLSELVADPRLYGFHGTLKPPMALADDVTERDLLDAVGAFAATESQIDVPLLALVELGDFVALVPAERCAVLQDLADRCVIEFDAFRRPAGVAELTRRRAAGLSARQDELLRRWGYPYVMEQGRFHLTLTGRVKDPGNARRSSPSFGTASPLHRPAAGGARPLCLPPTGARQAVHRSGTFQARRRAAPDHSSLASSLTKASAALSRVPSLTIVTRRGSAIS